METVANPSADRAVVERCASKQRSRVTNGKALFAQQGCGGCHTLRSAGTRGVIGPNFDTSERLNAAQIQNQLNLGIGGMPSFRRRLTDRQEAAATRSGGSSAFRRSSSSGAMPYVCSAAGKRRVRTSSA